MNRILLRAAALGLLASGLLHCSSDATESLPNAAAGASASGASSVAGAPAMSSAGAAASGAAGSLQGGGAGALPSAGGSSGALSAAGSGGNNGGASNAGAAGAPSAGGNAGAGAGAGAGGAPAYKPCPPAGTPCAIMPVGDSITAGYQSTTGGGYRLRLLHDIWTANHDATFVGDASSGPDKLDGKPFPKQNEGHSAYTIDPAPALMRSGISPLVPPALAKYPPQIVLLMIGTNDVGTKNDLPNAPKRLGNLIDAITSGSPNALLVVAQITPTGDDATNVLTQAYNAAIPGLVSSRVAAGKHIILVDMYTTFTAHAGYRKDWMFDSLHPNDTGYDVMGDAWYQAIAAHL